MLPPGASESRAAQKAALAGEAGPAGWRPGGSARRRLVRPSARKTRHSACHRTSCPGRKPHPWTVPLSPVSMPAYQGARTSVLFHACPCVAHPPPPNPGVLHEKQTEAELGELLRRLQGANLEGELDQFELVGCVYWGLADAGGWGCASLRTPWSGRHPHLAAPTMPGPLQANVREAARDYRKLTAISKDLAQREAELESRGYQVRASQSLLGCCTFASQLGHCPRVSAGTDGARVALLWLRRMIWSPCLVGSPACCSLAGSMPRGSGSGGICWSRGATPGCLCPQALQPWPRRAADLGQGAAGERLLGLCPGPPGVGAAAAGEGGAGGPQRVSPAPPSTPRASPPASPAGSCPWSLLNCLSQPVTEQACFCQQRACAACLPACSTQAAPPVNTPPALRPRALPQPGV